MRHWAWVSLTVWHPAWHPDLTIFQLNFVNEDNVEESDKQTRTSLSRLQPSTFHLAAKDTLTMTPITSFSNESIQLFQREIKTSYMSIQVIQREERNGTGVWDDSLAFVESPQMHAHQRLYTKLLCKKWTCRWFSELVTPILHLSNNSSFSFGLNALSMHYAFCVTHTQLTPTSTTFRSAPFELTPEGILTLCLLFFFSMHHSSCVHPEMELECETILLPSINLLKCNIHKTARQEMDMPMLFRTCHS